MSSNRDKQYGYGCLIAIAVPLLLTGVSFLLGSLILKLPLSLPNYIESIMTVGLFSLIPFLLAAIVLGVVGKKHPQSVPPRIRSGFINYVVGAAIGVVYMQFGIWKGIASGDEFLGFTFPGLVALGIVFGFVGVIVGLLGKRNASKTDAPTSEP